MCVARVTNNHSFPDAKRDSRRSSVVHPALVSALCGDWSPRRLTNRFKQIKNEQIRSPRSESTRQDDGCEDHDDCCDCENDVWFHNSIPLVLFVARIPGDSKRISLTTSLCLENGQLVLSEGHAISLISSSKQQRRVIAGTKLTGSGTKPSGGLKQPTLTSPDSSRNQEWGYTRPSLA
jgi:hypothetical protein